MLICSFDVCMMNCVLVYGLCLCCFVFRRVGLVCLCVLFVTYCDVV